VEVVKSPAPGKLSFKDSVIEAEEAWAVLHRRRRQAGLVPSRTFLRTLAAAAPVPAPVSSAGSVGEEDDVAFLPAAETVQDVTASLSEDPAGDGKEGEVGTIHHICAQRATHEVTESAWYCFM
jgi:hypothetical protein